MPPKGGKKPKAAAAEEAPPLEETVHLPEGVNIPDPPFSVVVAHIFGHTLCVEDEEGAETRDFDPCEQLVLAQHEAPTDDKGVVLVERAQLEEAAKSEAGKESKKAQAGEHQGPHMASALRKLVEAQREPRHRQKINAARKAAVAALQEGSKGENGEEGSAAPEAEAPRHLAADLIVLVVGFPHSAADVQDLRLDGIFDAVDVWVSVYVTGDSVTVNPETGVCVRSRPQPPDVLPAVNEAIHSAKVGSGLANAVVVTLPKGHALARPKDGEAGRARDAVLDAVKSEAAHRLQFNEWIKGTHRVVLPDAPSPGQQVDTRLYARYADSVDPSQQDVPLLLHCLCEQVALNLGGDGCEASSIGRQREEFRLLEACFAGAHGNLLLTDFLDPGLRTNTTGPADTGASTANKDFEEACFDDAEGEELIVPFADRVSRRHPRDQLPGGVTVAAVIHELFLNVRCPGIRRIGFPHIAPLSAGQRSGLRNRIYAFMSDLPTTEVERMLMLEDFGCLLEAAQPERKWCFKGRNFHEQIPSAFLVQALLEAFQQEWFVNTSYNQRHDCLLVALHQRLLPAHVLWHSWKGDFLAPADASKGLCAVPSYGDWKWLLDQAGDSGPKGLPTCLLDCDARGLGFCQVTEKVQVPSDGSVILKMTLGSGLRAREGDAEQHLAEPEAAAGGGESPKAATATREPPDTPAPSLHTSPLVHILKNNLVFGIITDTGWAKVAAQIQEVRIARESAEAEAAEEAARMAAEKAAADQLRQAQGLSPAESPALGDNDEDEEEDVDAAAKEDPTSPATVTERRLEQLCFGILWVAFPDSARCTFRMNHERPWYAEGDEVYDVVIARPGMLATFSPLTGPLIQVSCNGAVREIWPPQLVGLQPADAGEAVDSESAPPLKPGCQRDAEVARTVTPFGVLIRELLSGRREVHHPDGTHAIRNPTMSELRAQCENSRRNGIRQAAFEGLERILATYEQLFGDASQLAAPSEEEKAAGLPGHWLVSRPDGRLFARASVSLAPAAAPATPREESNEEGQIGEQEPPAGQQPASVAGEASATDAARLQAILGGRVVEGGEVVEYELKPVSMHELIDPHTGHHIRTNKHGVLQVDGLESAPRLIVLADGTRIIRTTSIDGYSVVVEQERMASVTCKIAPRAYLPVTTLDVQCPDGTQVQVLAQRLNEKGDLVNADPNMGPTDDFCTNASVAIHRPDGSVVFSKGDGDVHVFSSREASELGVMADRAALLTPPEHGVYTAHCDKDCIALKDLAGNSFVVRGDQTIETILGVSMGDVFLSPRCAVPGAPYSHPDAKFLPLPEGATQPRLFIVYGDGEAEEVLPEGVGQHELLVSETDPAAEVIRGEPMGKPMETCKSHTVIRTSSVVAPVVPQTPVELPPCIAGLETAMAPPQRTFREVRQFVEYPAIDDEKWEAFCEALSSYKQHEEARTARHAGYGARISSGKGYESLALGHGAGLLSDDAVQEVEAGAAALPLKHADGGA